MKLPRPATSNTRVCNTCKKEYPLTDFHVSKENRGGHKLVCKHCSRKKSKEYDDKNKLQRREKMLLDTYGITEQEYQTMLEYQGGVCAICERPPKTKRLSVDHEHQRQEKNKSPESRRIRVRGLLCHRCNRALGLLGNDPQKLLVAVENLSRYMSEYYAKRLVDTVGLDDARRLMGNTMEYLERFEKRKPK